MPYIHIQVSGEENNALAAQVAAKASELTSSILNKDPALTAVVVDFVAQSNWFVAGQSLAEHDLRSYHWLVSITDETNTKSQKAAYMKAVHEAMQQLLSGVAEHSYIHIADLRAAAYGFGGLTQEHRYQQTN